ncbi:MAG: phosphoribosyltransferase family protein [Acidimicrobiia bacterium]|nr:phosphoribosyltransferase family protein [Acidimicrobiia bacterium]
MTVSRFTDRRDAGRRLAEALRSVVGDADDVLVLGLPRGGVPVAAEVARALDAELDVLVVRKVGTPGHRELAMGAVASGGVTVRNESVLGDLRIDDEAFEEIASEERREVRRREEDLRGERADLVLDGRTVVVVDDGVATGSTMRAALEAIRSASPRRLIVAVPTAPPETCRALDDLADDTVCLLTPRRFRAVGAWYDDFAQTTDDEVRRLLQGALQ